METVNAPAGWFEKPDPDHHMDCAAQASEYSPCDCAALDEADRIAAAEARADGREDR